MNSSIPNQSKRMTQTTQGAKTEFRRGPDPRGPTRCTRCLQPFKKGEAWRRLTSPADAKLGAYVIGIHDQCAGGGQ